VSNEEEEEKEEKSVNPIQGAALLESQPCRKRQQFCSNSSSSILILFSFNDPGEKNVVRKEKQQPPSHSISMYANVGRGRLQARITQFLIKAGE